MCTPSILTRVIHLHDKHITARPFITLNTNKNIKRIRRYMPATLHIIPSTSNKTHTHTQLYPNNGRRRQQRIATLHHLLRNIFVAFLCCVCVCGGTVMFCLVWVCSILASRVQTSKAFTRCESTQNYADTRVWPCATHVPKERMFGRRSCWVLEGCDSDVHIHHT